MTLAEISEIFCRLLVYILKKKHVHLQTRYKSNKCTCNKYDHLRTVNIYSTDLKICFPRAVVKCWLKLPYSKYNTQNIICKISVN